MEALEPQPPQTPPPRQPVARLVAGALFGALVLLGYLVIKGFLVPLLWAAILSYITWPLYVLIRRTLRERRTISALAMSILLAVVIILPLLSVAVSLRQEVQESIQWLKRLSEAGGSVLPAWLVEIPWIGHRLAELADRLAAHPALVGQWLSQRTEVLLGEAADLLGMIGRNAIKFAFTLIAVFFFYRDGERIVDQVRRGLWRLFGDRLQTYWDATAGMTEAVVYGLVLTALAQGFLAGVGYAIVGLRTAVLFGTLTAIFALVPFGAPLVWGSVSLWLLWHGAIWSAVFLLLWGTLVVSLVDNLIRPLVISASTRLPFLVVLFGVLGGLNAFGLVGLFLGPVVLAILWAIWQQWLSIARNGPNASHEQDSQR